MMSNKKPTTEAQKLVGQLQLARLQLSKAESSLQAAKERARVAKRRRKEAKLVARRARKQLKRAKTELAEAREAVAKAESKLAQAGKQRLRSQAAARRRAQARQGEPYRQKALIPTQKPRVSAIRPRPGAGAPSLPAAEATRQLNSETMAAVMQASRLSAFDSAAL